MSQSGRGLPFRVGAERLPFTDPLKLPASALGEHSEPLLPANCGRGDTSSKAVTAKQRLVPPQQHADFA